MLLLPDLNQVFAPLAKLLGVYCIKEELEDLSLRYMQPQVYHHINSWQEKQMSQYQKAFAAGKHDLEALLAADPYLQWHAQGWVVRVRQKPVYSIYKQLRALQRAKERTDAAVRQETVAAGSAAAAAEDMAAGKRAGRGGLRPGGTGGDGGDRRRSSLTPAQAAAAAMAAAAADHSSSSSKARSAKGQQQAAVNLLSHLKELPDQGVFLQVIVDELEGTRANPNYQMESHQLCYYVLGLVHSIWSPIPGALQDFIGSPKTNGYQSLHTRVVPLSILSKNCPLLPMEVQIRTHKMDKLADLGVAATNWGVDANHMRRLGAIPSMGVAAGRGLPQGSNGRYADAFGGQGGYSASPSSSPMSSPSGSVDESSAGARSAGSKPSSSSSNGRLSSSDSSSSSSSSSSNGRTFWMNLATFMLESMAAGGSSLAAITGAIAGSGSSSSSTSTSSSMDEDSSTASSSGRDPSFNQGTNGGADAGGAGQRWGQMQGKGYFVPSNGMSKNGNGNGNGNGSLGKGTYYPLNGNGFLKGAAGVASPNGSSTASSSSSRSDVGGTTTSSSSNGVSNGGPTGSPFMPTFMPQEQLDGNWLTQMRKWQEEFVGSLSAREFVDGVTAEVLGQSVFVYTHTGELRRLPKVS